VYWADERARGTIKYLEEKGIPFEKLDISSASYTMGARVAEYLEKNPATNLVISQGGAGPWGTAAGVRSAGKKPGEVIVAGYDIMPPTVQEIKGGYVTFVIDQHPYLQGYLPVVQLYLIKEFAMRTWSVDTGTGYVDKNNVDQVNALVMQRVR
jgi:simple sugar transport system substrate-binding protein